MIPISSVMNPSCFTVSDEDHGSTISRITQLDYKYINKRCIDLLCNSQNVSQMHQNNGVIKPIKSTCRLGVVAGIGGSVVDTLHEGKKRISVVDFFGLARHGRRRRCVSRSSNQWFRRRLWFFPPRRSRRACLGTGTAFIRWLGRHGGRLQNVFGLEPLARTGQDAQTGRRSNSSCCSSSGNQRLGEHTCQLAGMRRSIVHRVVVAVLRCYYRRRPAVVNHRRW
jgi:hypothetical protein